MKKLGAGIAVVAVLAGAGAVGTSYVMGGKIETGLKEAAMHWSRNGLTVEVVKYERGVLHSSAETLWTYTDPRDTSEDEAVGNDEEDGENPAATPRAPIQFKATHAISHGPWPMGQAAQVHSSFVPVAGAQPELVAALKDRPALLWDASVGWGRNSHHVVSSPALEWTSDGTAITWGGLQGEWTMPADLQGLQGTARLPALRVQAASSGTLELTDAALRFDLARSAEPQLVTGPWGITLASLEHQPGEDGGEALQAKGFALESNTSLAGEVAGMVLKASLQSGQAGARSASDLALDVAVRNVDAAWLAQLLQWQKSEMDTGERLQLIQGSLPQLLARQPVLEIQRLAVRTPEGLSEASASLAYTGNGQQLQTLVQDLQASVRAQLPKPVLAALLGQKVRRAYLQMLEDADQEYDEDKLDAAVQASVDERITALAAQGILQAQAGGWSTQLDFAKGSILLNEKPLDAEGTSSLLGALID